MVVQRLLFGGTPCLSAIPELDSCLKALRAGDGRVEALSARPGSKHLVTLIDELRNRDIGFKVLTGQGAEIYRAWSANLWHSVSLAQFERELIIECAHAGLKAALARARLGGQPRWTVQPS